MSRDEALRLGDMAAHLLSDEVVQEVFRRLEEGYADAWRSTDITDTMTREQLYHASKALNDLRRHLKVIADSGTFERAQLSKAGLFTQSESKL